MNIDIVAFVLVLVLNSSMSCAHMTEINLIDIRLLASNIMTIFDIRCYVVTSFFTIVDIRC